MPIMSTYFKVFVDDYNHYEIINGSETVPDPLINSILDFKKNIGRTE